MNPSPLSPEPVTDSFIGTVIADRYQIVRKLGEGGMGVVYEALHVGVGKRVAIKCLHPEFARKPDVVARFHNEARAAATIGSAHVVDVLDVGRLQDGTAWLVMEFLHGQELSRLIEHEILSIGRATRIIAQLCEAMTVVHKRGIVHRDLKPENIFLTTLGAQTEFVKILDFGISKFTGVPVTGSEPHGGLGLTRTNAILGSPLYMSPEQFGRSSSVTPASDLYALGAVLFRALSGQPPFVNDELGPLMVQVITGPAPDIRTLRPDIPPALAQVIARMLATRPQDRFPDCASARDALAPFLSMDAAPPPGVPLSHSPQVTPRSIEASGARVREPLDVSPLPKPPLPLASSPSQPGVAPTVPSLSAPPVVSLQPEEKPHRRRLAIGASVVACAAMISLAAWAALRPAATVHTPQPVRASTDTPSAVAPQRVPSTPPAVIPPVAPLAAPSEVHVVIRSQPDDARIELDGDVVNNPFDASIPQSTTRHRLVVTRQGYRRVVIDDLTLRYTQTLVITLRHGQGTDARQVRSRPDTSVTEIVDVPQQPVGPTHGANPQPQNTHGVTVPADQGPRGSIPAEHPLFNPWEH